PDDALTQAQLFEERWSEELAEICRLSVEIDRARLRDYRGEPKWEPSKTGEAFIQTVVAPAASEDPEIFRAPRRRASLLDPVGALGKTPALLDRAGPLAAARPPQERRIPPGPTRDELLAIVQAARSGETVSEAVPGG